MYQAKELGSASFRFYDPAMNIKILERLLTESALQRALEKNEFIIYYQPGYARGAKPSLAWKRWCAGSIPKKA